MLRKGGYEFLNKGGYWVGNMQYTVSKNGYISSISYVISEFTAYRHVSDLIEHPMTKEVEG